MDGIELEPSAESAARASIAMWGLVVDAIPDAWMDERNDAAAIVTRIAVGGFNGVWTKTRAPDPVEVDELLDAVAASGVPYSLHLREGAPPELTQLARDRGMEIDAEEPTMVLEDPTSLDAARDVPGFAIRRLEPGEGTVHARIAATVFGDDLAIAEAAVTPEILSSPETRCYVGEAGGEAVATAMGVTYVGTVGVFAVATLPEHRGRGYGSALTARAVLDGFANGARWAWLQADAAAAPLYERLGFHAVETTTIWTTD